jgi:hypothetical protein
MQLMTWCYNFGFLKILLIDVVVIVSEFNITSGLNWDDGLSNETSFTYKNLTVNIVNQV